MRASVESATSPDLVPIWYLSPILVPISEEAFGGLVDRLEEKLRAR